MRTESGLLVAAVLGALQGTVEWLPLSSEGFVAVATTALGADPAAAVRLALFLHLGTALSATVFYRQDLSRLLRGPGDEQASNQTSGSEGESADRRFLAVATLVSGVIGVGAYLLLEEVVSALAGGAVLALVGAALVATGVLLRTTSERRRTDGGREVDRPAGDATPTTGSDDLLSVPAGERERPDIVDAVVVGACQGVAVLPGVSRSGTTVGALLLRGHDGPRALQLSFLLSIPAAVGAAGIAVADGGVPAVDPLQASVALGVAAVVGYLTVDLLTRLVRRMRLWLVCVGLGTLAVAGGLGAGL